MSNDFCMDIDRDCTHIARMRSQQAMADAALTDATDTIIKLRSELAALKADNESLKLDAEQWRAYQKRKQDLLDRGFLRSPLREEAELNPAMAKGEQG